MDESMTIIEFYNCDFYLLEHWDTASPLSQHDQMLEIFKQFNQLPAAERAGQKYDKDENELSEEQKQLLSNLRLPNERLNHNGGTIWLRTHYSDDSDVLFEPIMEELMSMDDGENVFSDRDRYNFGSDWKKILNVMPQLITPSPDYFKYTADYLAECQLRERMDKALCEFSGYPWPEAASCIYDVYDNYHIFSEMAMIVVMDEETFYPKPKSGGKDEEDGENEEDARSVKVNWVDAFGNVVRWVRWPLFEACQWCPCRFLAADHDYPWWTDAEIGSAYKLDSEEEIEYVGLEDLADPASELEEFLPSFFWNKDRDPDWPKTDE